MDTSGLEQTRLKSGSGLWLRGHATSPWSADICLPWSLQPGRDSITHSPNLPPLGCQFQAHIVAVYVRDSCRGCWVSWHCRRDLRLARRNPWYMLHATFSTEFLAGRQGNLRALSSPFFSVYECIVVLKCTLLYVDHGLQFG
jgi:hypothetical protein